METKKSWEDVYQTFKSCVEEKVEKFNLGMEKRSFKVGEEGYVYDFFFVNNTLFRIELYSPKIGLVEVQVR